MSTNELISVITVGFGLICSLWFGLDIYRVMLRKQSELRTPVSTATGSAHYSTWSTTAWAPFDGMRSFNYPDTVTPEECSTENPPPGDLLEPPHPKGPRVRRLEIDL